MLQGQVRNQAIGVIVRQDLVKTLPGYLSALSSQEHTKLK